MAKGDAGRVRNDIDYYGQSAQNNLNNLRQRGLEQNQSMWNTYQAGLGRNMEDYGNIMQNYQNLLNRPDIALSPQYKGNVDSALSGYQNFANTGGFSPQDIQDIRARAIAPTRAVYQNTQNELSRANRLGGGLVNYAASKAKVARDLGQAISDANVNANASIAEMVQKGKLAGLGGLSTVGMGQEDMQRQIDMANMQKILSSAEGMRSLYGTNPALADVFGKQVLASSGQGIDVEGLQNRLALGLIGAQIDASRIPSNYQQALGNIGGALGLASQVGGALGGLSGGGSGFGGGGSWWKSLLGLAGGGGGANDVANTGGNWDPWFGVYPGQAAGSGVPDADPRHD